VAQEKRATMERRMSAQGKENFFILLASLEIIRGCPKPAKRGVF
jgi:hypothetical protein